MSQSHNSRDSQALLQSMLQRLRLQPGKDSQPVLHTPASTTAASTWRQGGHKEALNFQNVNSSPVNGCEFINSGADSNSRPTGGQIQQQSQGCEADGGPVLHNTGAGRVLAQATLPAPPANGRGQLFSGQSPKDAEVTFSENTDGKREDFGGSAMTMNISSSQDAVRNVGQNQDRIQGFLPKVYMWSMKPTDADINAGVEEQGMLHVENGTFGLSAQSKDLQFAANSQTTKNSSSIRKQRSSENRTRRWTQKIKDRWRDRQEKIGKKSKEEGGSGDQKSEQVNEKHLASENMNSGPNKEEEKTLPSADSIDACKNSSANTEDLKPEGRIRSYSDFEFGLGSFSLLDEIVTGQEWAKFLNPNISAPSINPNPSEDPLRQSQFPPNPYNSVRPSMLSNLKEVGNNQWKYWGTEATPGLNTGMTHTAPASLHVSMEVSEAKQQESVHREADQTEPMDDGHNQSDLQLGQRCPGQQRRPPSFVQPVDILDKSRVHLNRKRQHQSAERRDNNFQIEKDVAREGYLSTSSPSSSQEMDEIGESRRDNIMSLYTLNSPSAPLSPSSFNPFAVPPRGVLKHSISQDSECSMETLTKRRRVEENRRVHFSEEVVSIEPPELDLDAIESEEESEMDNDSVIEQECEVEKATVGEVAPARRPALPAWILALKRKNTGRRPR